MSNVCEMRRVQPYVEHQYQSEDPVLRLYVPPVRLQENRPAATRKVPSRSQKRKALVNAIVTGSILLELGAAVTAGIKAQAMAAEIAQHSRGYSTAMGGEVLFGAMVTALVFVGAEWLIGGVGYLLRDKETKS